MEIYKDSDKKSWFAFSRSPLWILLLLAAIGPVWLTIHTHGIIAGDEAMIGVQAEHILLGEHPVYFYGQPYMGSLEAYFFALIFLVFGPSAWVLRATTTIISLMLVVLTWYFSAALADAAHLPPRAKQRFRIIATLVSAFPPLYSLTSEMRAWGGYVDVFVIMLWLLFAAFRLTQRWQAGTSLKELALRWAGLGFLIGLAFWIDPLAIYAIVAIVLWIGWYFLPNIIKLGLLIALVFWIDPLAIYAIAIMVLWWYFVPKGLSKNKSSPETHRSPSADGTTKNVEVPNTIKRCTSCSKALKEALLLVIIIPTSIIGSAPALYWGAHHQWENITYVFSNGSAGSNLRLTAILGLAKVYTTCLVPRVIGGALPTEPDVTLTNPHIVTFGLVVSVICFFVVTAAIALSFFWKHPLLISIRRLTSITYIFGVCTFIIFCTSSISFLGIYAGCGPWDLVGRYVVPLVVILPFFVAAVFNLPEVALQERQERSEGLGEELASVWRRLSMLTVLQGCLAVVLLAYCGMQWYSYVKANPDYTFQASGCVAAPADNDPIIAYMQSEHIHYAWAEGWIGDPITFKTNANILVTDLHDRITANVEAVLHSERPSILMLAKDNDTYPAQLKILDTAQIDYRVKRFFSEPGVDLLVITPLNRSIPPDLYHFRDSIDHCS